MAVGTRADGVSPEHAPVRTQNGQSGSDARICLLVGEDARALFVN